MLSPLVQGQIVQAEVCDPEGGNRKRRPLVIVTATSEISDQEPLVAVAVTSRFREPLQDDEVLLPWHPAGNVVRSSESLAWRSAAGCARLP